jgi:hypothetical protein
MNTDKSHDEDVRRDPDDGTVNRRRMLLAGTALAASTLGAGHTASQAQQAQPAPAQPAPTGQRPNILVIWGDDVGIANVSAYSFGVMGVKTPNIDRIGREGVMFTDYYAEQSCTAGRSSFITGQSGLRTGNTKVGLPGAPAGLQPQDITIAEALKPLGYATGQFGKNHLGDRNEFLPTVHGFDEFFGNLIISTRRRSRSTPTIRRTRASGPSSARAGSSSAWQPTRTIRPSIRASGGWAGRPSRTPGRSPGNAWRRSTTRPRTQPSTSSSGRRRPTSRSSAGGTARACTSTRM